MLKICLLVPSLMSSLTLTLLSGGAFKRFKSQGLKLLSNLEICDVLEMGKGWLYRRHKSGEISAQRWGLSRTVPLEWIRKDGSLLR